jgi:hypothetical protein
MVDGLGALHDALGLPGQRPMLVGAVAILLANLLSSRVVLWSIVRLRAPTLAHGATDADLRRVRRALAPLLAQPCLDLDAPCPIIAALAELPAGTRGGPSARARTPSGRRSS